MSQQILKRRSRLSKSCKEVLKDPGALAYFIQFMDSRHLGHLVKFYLAAESFRVSAESIYAKKHGEQLSSRDVKSSHSQGPVDGKSNNTEACDEINMQVAVEENGSSSGQEEEVGGPGAKRTASSPTVDLAGSRNEVDSGISMGLRESKFLQFKRNTEP